MIAIYSFLIKKKVAATSNSAHNFFVALGCFDRGCPLRGVNGDFFFAKAKI